MHLYFDQDTASKGCFEYPESQLNEWETLRGKELKLKVKQLAAEKVPQKVKDLLFSFLLLLPLRDCNQSILDI